VIRLSLILAVGAMLLVGIGCGGDDSPDTPPSSARPCQPLGPGADTSTPEGATIAYFLSCDPAVCTEDATKNHIKADYGGSIARCEEVRRNNRLARNDVTIAGDALVSGNEAEVRGQVLVTGETFVVELENVDGSWKIDRIRGSQ
jgi:hypothetical protein